MEKKDYLSMMDRFSVLQDREKPYRKELIGFVNEAFNMHGNEFVLKPSDDYETWEEADEMEEGLVVENHFPTYFEIEDKRGIVHEIYPTRIYRKDASGLDYIDGYDYKDCEFTEDWFLDSSTETLESIAYFINAVLEQEMNL